ncbi:MAG: hypothetical protein BWY14_01333 [Parcubacteria group bacterium ADurb.Bin192]|nr:MAG: hypothetical protein BWY14_01333 [Parcubacteria group bacterium ADurb.Bin192]
MLFISLALYSSEATLTPNTFMLSLPRSVYDNLSKALSPMALAPTDVLRKILLAMLKAISWPKIVPLNASDASPVMANT